MRGKKGEGPCRGFASRGLSSASYGRESGGTSAERLGRKPVGLCRSEMRTDPPNLARPWLAQRALTGFPPVVPEPGDLSHLPSGWRCTHRPPLMSSVWGRQRFRTRSGAVNCLACQLSVSVSLGHWSRLLLRVGGLGGGGSRCGSGLAPRPAPDRWEPHPLRPSSGQCPRQSSVRGGASEREPGLLPGTGTPRGRFLAPEVQVHPPGLSLSPPRGGPIPVRLPTPQRLQGLCPGRDRSLVVGCVLPMGAGLTGGGDSSPEVQHGGPLDGRGPSKPRLHPAGLLKRPQRGAGGSLSVR